MKPVVLDRLRNGRDISAVLRGRRQRAGRLAVVHARARADAGVGEPPRIAVVASRRIGNAVARNRAKRLLREASRHIPWAPDVDIVLVARATCATSTYVAVHGELSRLAAELDVVLDGSGTSREARAAGARS